MTDYETASALRMKHICNDIDAASSTWEALKTALGHIHVLTDQLAETRCELSKVSVQTQVGRLVEGMGLETRITNYGHSFTVYDGNIHGTGKTPLEAFEKYAEKRGRGDKHEAVEGAASGCAEMDPQEKQT